MKLSDYERIKKVIHYLDQNYSDQPNLNQLAKIAGLSASHFHRMFTRWAGATPKDFLQAITFAHAKKRLENDDSVMNASFEVGLSGPGRLHDLFVTLEGVSPGEFKNKAADLTIEYVMGDTPFGLACMATTARGICFLEFVQTEKAGLLALQKKWSEAKLKKNRTLKLKLDELFKSTGTRTSKLNVYVSGTALQLKVWEALLKIPEGKTVSYQDLARAIGKPKASRAVANAIGKNPIAFLIPCHRVIRGTGALGGYRWGIERKTVMLSWERIKVQTPSKA